jgi:hypothetical protein
MYRSLMFRALENEQRDVPHLPKLSRRALGRHFLLILRVLCCSADMSQLLDLEEEYDEDDDVDGVNTSASSDPQQLLMENSSLMVGFYSKLRDIAEHHADGRQSNQPSAVVEQSVGDSLWRQPTQRGRRAALAPGRPVPTTVQCGRQQRLHAAGADV